MAKVNINDVLQGLIQPIGSLKGGSTYPVTAADQIWVYTDQDTHRPLDEYLGAMKTETAETTQTFVSNATALTEGKITKTSIVGGNSAKCKVGDIVLVADGNIYKISAIDETNITLALPALASYAPAAAIRNRVLHGDLKDATGAPSYPSGGGGASIQSIDGYFVSDEEGAIATDLTNIKLKVPFVLNLYEDNTLSGEPAIQIVMTNNIDDIYYIGMISLIGQMLVVMAKDDESGEYQVGMSGIPTSMESTLFNKPIMVPDNLDGPTPILPCSMNDNGKVLSVVNGEAQ